MPIIAVEFWDVTLEKKVSPLDSQQVLFQLYVVALLTALYLECSDVKSYPQSFESAAKSFQPLD